MKVSVWMQEQSNPIEFENIKNAYTKGAMYCVYTKDEYVYKFPLCNIFRVKEDYKQSKSKKEVK